MSATKGISRTKKKLTTFESQKRSSIRSQNLDEKINATPRHCLIDETAEEDSSDDEPESGSDEETPFVNDETPEHASEFWQLQKLIKYIKAGNQTATTVALCLLKNFNLSNRTTQRAIREMGGLEVLVNLLETKDVKCQLGSLGVLSQMGYCSETRRYLIDLGIVSPLIDLLKHPARDVRILTAETMASIAMMRKARKQIRVRSGIALILDAMDVPDNVLRRNPDQLNDNERQHIAVAIACAKVLNSLSSSPKIKEQLRKHGVVFFMSRFLQSTHIELIIPIMGAIQQCADLKVFRLAFEQIGIISEIVRHLCDSEAASIKYKQMLVNHHKSSHTVESSSSPELDAQNEKKASEEASRGEKDRLKLEENCALAIYKCAANKLTRDMVRQSGGLDPLCRLIQSDNIRSNKNLLAAVTGAIWKCAISPENVSRFNQNSLVASLVPLLEENEDDQVLANVVGALAECCVDPANRHVLRINNGLPKLIRLLSGTYEPLLENLPLVIKECAEDEQCMDVINDPSHSLDGVRLVWSLLKHPSNVIKRNACRALVPCIKNAKDSPEMVRAFVGGLEVTVSILDSDDTQVLAAVCATIAAIAVNPENLGILTDHGVVKKLAKLVHTEDEHLRSNLTLAIAFCCEWDRNNYEFGRLNAVAPLVNYANSKNKHVLKGVCIAFYHLSKEPLNCVTMHTCGVIKHVLRLVGSDDPEVQIAAATTIRHIRKLALNTEKLNFGGINSLEEMDYCS
ncbi:GSCOCG00000734001-RA-CDS [Cotesia congregata]|uniref:Similar to gudu: Armadillo repeat-containing protein gudu (Drosophila melanogaster) n=1 Tax=Cotesia congregata TaxID=51543 RepID=A0A8J2H972_COTCN|nr:GSCOCG00000734001-RA-CDS [Cotesia congregata]CAG5087009.1 Similar to gudu: Armadillo repeat-containing protein gudu (Drosophila melanogaster) [Cotesia congregata]